MDDASEVDERRKTNTVIQPTVQKSTCYIPYNTSKNNKKFDEFPLAPDTSEISFFHLNY